MYANYNFKTELKIVNLIFLKLFLFTFYIAIFSVLLSYIIKAMYYTTGGQVSNLMRYVVRYARGKYVIAVHWVTYNLGPNRCQLNISDKCQTMENVANYLNNQRATV